MAAWKMHKRRRKRGGGHIGEGTCENGEGEAKGEQKGKKGLGQVNQGCMHSSR